MSSNTLNAPVVGITAPPVIDSGISFANNGTSLWLYTSANNTPTPENLGMKAGTSPSTAALTTGGFETAFQANTGDLSKPNLERAGQRESWHAGRYEPEHHGAAQRRLGDRLPGQHGEPLDHGKTPGRPTGASV